MPAADRARARMVDALCNGGRLHTRAVEEAFRAVPRHCFLPGLPLREAYADEAVAVQHVEGIATSSASQPSMMAIMLEQLDLRPGQRVLEIGAGTGYNAALMARIVGPTGVVTAVDIDEELVATAAAHLAAAGTSGVELVCGDGALGHPPGAPYDRIVLTVGSADIRPEWVAQLRAGGRLLLPLAVRGSQLSMALDLGADGLLRSASVRSCAFIRLRGLGAGHETTVPLDEGRSLLVPEDGPGVDRAAVTTALAAPGRLLTTRVPLRSADVFDGFGLWLGLTDPRACRLLVAAGREDDLPDELLPLGPGSGTVALTAAPGEAGLAAVVLGTGAVHGWDALPVAVRSFGPAGAEPAVRLRAALADWRAAGHPDAPRWRFTAVPAGHVGGAAEGARSVVKTHCRLLVDLLADTGRPRGETG
jgi:protein-L-isoaspartate(D-aspartate) O-methyltransferase